ncbi:MAG: hypothetical protein K2G03_06730, partial [Bacilli bacterium]|nr:hypothetical protein [Bacilli bacterium]
INGESLSHLYEDIEKDRKLEIVDDLLHARITSLNIEHLRNMIIWDLDPRNDYRKYQLRGFNLFSTYGFFWSTDNERVGTINDLTQEYIGPSLITLDKEYYEYLKNLVSSTLQIELSSSKIKEEGLVKLIKSYYSANKKY